MSRTKALWYFFAAFFVFICVLDFTISDGRVLWQISGTVNAFLAVFWFMEGLKSD